jgi:two-component system, OmpR family, sensor histidine kinase KdpD
MNREAMQAGVAAAVLTAITISYRVLHVTNATIVALSFLVVVLVVASISRLRVAIAASVLAMLSFNFFFLPPVGTLTIADPQNWVALFAFLAVSLVASHLSSTARERTQEAMARQDELARLFDLTRDVLLVTDSGGAIAAIARLVARRFTLEAVAICRPDADAWTVENGGTATVSLDSAALDQVFATVQNGIEFDAKSRSYGGHRMIDVGGHSVALVPLRLGTRPIGLLAAAGRQIEPGTLDALAGVVAIAIERAHFLEERKATELARQSEELKSALLASLAHDLRTPLTAIRVAATNLGATVISDVDRREQSELVLAEVERLTRLFQNILDMARIDAGAVVLRTQWVHPLEIVEAARSQVEHTLAGRTVNTTVEGEFAVKLDPPVTAAAIAHLLENAAQYTPTSASIDVTARVDQGAMTIVVRDHGPGISQADLPRLFERFYRGSAARRRISGTGMGLAIARGLLAAEGGSVWAENCRDRGAQFTVSIPAEIRPARQDTEVESVT